MSKDSDKPDEVLEAERNGGQTFDPTVDDNEQTAEQLVAAGKCPDCRGEGIRNPGDHQVCQTCQGSGKA